jgi:hypothetical protein
MEFEPLKMEFEPLKMEFEPLKMGWTMSRQCSPNAHRRLKTVDLLTGGSKRRLLKQTNAMDPPKKKAKRGENLPLPDDMVSSYVASSPNLARLLGMRCYPPREDMTKWFHRKVRARDGKDRKENVPDEHCIGNNLQELFRMLNESVLCRACGIETVFQTAQKVDPVLMDQVTIDKRDVAQRPPGYVGNTNILCCGCNEIGKRTLDTTAILLDRHATFAAEINRTHYIELEKKFAESRVPAGVSNVLAKNPMRGRALARFCLQNHTKLQILDPEQGIRCRAEGCEHPAVVMVPGDEQPACNTPLHYMPSALLHLAKCKQVGYADMRESGTLKPETVRAIWEARKAVVEQFPGLRPHSSPSLETPVEVQEPPV